MDERRAKRIRELLVAKRDELVTEGNLNVRADDKGVEAAKPDDDAKPLEEMNQVIASNRNRGRAARLKEIDAAIARLDEDPEDFGLCEDCDAEIKPRRLELMPWTRLCIGCQSEREQSDGPGGRRHITDYK